MKIHHWKDGKGEERFFFFCPGCKITHAFDQRWEFNGDLEKPTFSPSLLTEYPYGNPSKDVRCHSFVREGKIQFLSDCTHELKGQTVAVPDWKGEY